ncbi:MAG: hypothetical protein ABS882_03175 [Lysinibacillus sp.]
MRVNNISTNKDAYRQTQFYAGEHLAYYYDPTALKNRPKSIIKDANGIFTRYLEKVNGQRQVVSQSTTKEKIFLEKRQQHAHNEELFQRLNYKNGVHYSATIKEAIQP